MSDLKKLGQSQIPLKCEICDKEFKNNIGLKQHVNKVHNFKEEYQCNICQKVFKIQSNLASHVKAAHENKKLHKCDSCEKPFFQAEYLKKHYSRMYFFRIYLFSKKVSINIIVILFLLQSL